MALQVIIVPVTAYQQNCSILICEQTRKAAFVDPGGEQERLFAVLKEHNAELEKIFLTHGHLDHVGAAKFIAQTAQVPIEGPHQADQFWLDGLEEYAKMMHFPATQTFTPDRYLKDGEQVQFGNIILRVLHCPGHTPGHVVFYHAPSQLAWVGDVLFQGSIGRTDFPQGNHQQLIASIKTKLWPLGDDITFIPGHGPTSTFGEERRHNAFVADSRFG